MSQKENKSAYDREYYIQNKEHIKQEKTAYHKANEDKIDTISHLTDIVRKVIRYDIKKNAPDNKERLNLKLLGYSTLDLMQHLENLFEPWMMRENIGFYFPSKWNKADQITWKWMLSFVETFTYTSMYDDNFKKHWTISNLKPMSTELLVKPRKKGFIGHNTGKIKLNEKQLEQVKQLFYQEIGKRKIAKIMSVDRSTISRAYKKLGLDASQRQLSRTAFQMAEKICPTCPNKPIKPIDQFRVRKGKYADGSERLSYESSCLDCEAIQSNENGKRRFHRKKHDPDYIIRRFISHMVWRTLTDNNSSKDGESSLTYLGYTITELRTHIEKLWESWMNWNNYGKYNGKAWKDNDPTTWTWQLDHIIPQSDLPFKTMQDDNFKRCWSLENLRPLSSKQNNLDGVRRIRHSN